MKNNHLSLDERLIIEECLNSSYLSFTDIGYKINKDRTTISKEIRKNYTTIIASTWNNSKNKCIHRSHCSFKHMCGKLDCFNDCKRCLSYNCNTSCDNFEKNECDLLLKRPYVCNSCSKRKTCRLEKRVYRADKAHEKYLDTLSSSREGINSTIEEIEQLEAILKPLIVEKKQPISHIIINHKDIKLSEKTIYNYIENEVYLKILEIYHYLKK
jgi:IS30 family transposase